MLYTDPNHPNSCSRRKCLMLYTDPNHPQKEDVECCTLTLTDSHRLTLTDSHRFSPTHFSRNRVERVARVGRLGRSLALPRRPRSPRRGDPTRKRFGRIARKFLFGPGSGQNAKLCSSVTLESSQFLPHRAWVRRHRPDSGVFSFGCRSDDQSRLRKHGGRGAKYRRKPL